MTQLVTQTWGSSTGLRNRLVEAAAHLPIGDPATLVRIARLCQDPSAESREVARQVQRDAAFTATVLRLANSARYARDGPVGEVGNAISRLGHPLVGSLALATPGLRMLRGAPDDLVGASKRLHRHAVRTGLAAQLLDPTGDAELSLAAGLIHNIGLNVILCVDPERFRRLLATSNSGEQLREIEEDLLGVTHAELGGLITERWRYPCALVIATTDHDQPEPHGLAATVRIADLIGRETGVGVEAPERIPDDLFRRLVIAPDATRSRLGAVFLADVRLSPDVACTDDDAPARSSCAALERALGTA